MNLADAIAQHKDRVPAALERVRAMSGEQLTATIDMFGAIQTAVAVACLQLALKHEVHHRGQLGAYLRAMGGKARESTDPPAIANSRDGWASRAHSRRAGKQEKFQLREIYFS